MKRILALVIVFFICCSTVFSDNTAETEENCASIEFKYFETNNIAKYRFFDINTPEKVSRKGRGGVKFMAADAAVLYLYIDVADDYIYAPDGTEVKVSVDYYDEGGGYFTLQYGSVEGDYYQPDDYVWLENTKEWKTHEFIIDGAKFTGQCAGYDLRLAEWSLKHGRSKEDVIFGGIKIEKLPPKLLNPLMSTDELGNIFAGNDEKNIKIKLFNNYGGAVSADVELNITDFDGNVVDTQSISLDFSGDGNVTLIPKVAKFGTYCAKATITAKDDLGHEYTGEKSIQFSVADKHKEGEPVNYRFGFSTHPRLYFNEPEKQKMLSKVIAETGSGMVRWDTTWAETEKEKKKYELPAYSTTIDALNENKIDTIMVCYAPTNDIYYKRSYWYEPPNNPEAEAAYIEYLKFVVTKYKGKLKYVEVWNEYNNSLLPAEKYAEMLKSAYPVIKSIDPDIKVIGGVTAMVPHGWIKQIFDAGAYDYFDIFSIHPYDFDGGFNVERWRNNLVLLREMMTEYGDMKPLWLTELGWSVSGAKAGVTEPEAASYGVQSYAMIQSENLADLMIWYDLHNDGLTDGNEHNFGAIRYTEAGDSPWSAKLPYIAFCTMNKFIGNAEPIDNIVYDDNNSALYRFRRKSDGKQFVLAYSDKQCKTADVDFGTDTVELIDLYGNKTGELHSENGVYSLGLSKDAVWLSGDFSKMENGKSDISINSNTFETVAGETAEFCITDAKNRVVTTEVDTELEVLSEKNGKIVFKTPAGENKTYDFSVTAYADGELCYTGKGTVTAMPPLEVKTETKTVSDKYCKAVVTVKNMSNYTGISGEVKLTNPEYIAAFANTAKIIDLKPQESRSFDMRLPEMIKRRNINIETTVTLNDGYEYRNSQNFGFSSLAHADKKPITDGIISDDEWQGIWFAADRADDVKEVKNWGGPSELSLSGNVMWDSENLYLCVDGSDNIFSQTNNGFNVWQGDCIQFSLNLPGSDEISEFAYSLTPKGKELYRFNSTYGHISGLVNNYSGEIGLYDGKTIYELAIPWTEIFTADYTPEAGTKVRFSALLNDNDGFGRRGWVEYGAGIGGKKDYNLFIDMELK